MPITRRRFITNGLKFVSLSAAMPGLFMEAAHAAESTAPRGSTPGKNKILVIVEMSGGNDALNTVIPFSDPKYATFRPGIGAAKNEVVQIGNGLGLHPSMTALGGMFERGQLAVLPGVGYPHPNRSHFESMDIWQTGNPEAKTQRTGWVARQFDEAGHLKSDPLSGVTLGSTLPLAMWSQNSPASVIGDGTNYGFDTRGPDSEKIQEARRRLYESGTTANSSADFVRKAGREIYASTDSIKSALQDYNPRIAGEANYPNSGLATRLKTIAQLIGGDLSTRVYYANIGGFDTHADQPRKHAALLGELSEAIAAFYRDLTLQKRDKDVVLMTFSEFGRRVQENGSLGTDHGAAGVMFVAGGALRGGVHGEQPGLDDLEDGDLRFHTDFRRVYATILDRWLGAPSAKVLGGEFAHLKFLA